jgi:hypothetical protein
MRGSRGDDRPAGGHGGEGVSSVRVDSRGSPHDSTLVDARLRRPLRRSRRRRPVARRRHAPGRVEPQRRSSAVRRRNDGRRIVGRAHDGGTVIALAENSDSALDVSNDGVAVGNLELPGTSGATLGFRWAADPGLQLLPSGNPKTAISSAYTATAVSTDGTTIVGTGQFRSSTGRPSDAVWIAVIPEPSTALLLGMGDSLFAGTGHSRRCRRPDLHV